MKKWLLLIPSHLAMLGIGFVLGIYLLPILIAPPAPSDEVVEASAKQAQFQGEFRRDLEDSDALHWGEGTVFIGQDQIALQGSIAPGPNYKMYLSNQFIETEAEFLAQKSNMAVVGDVRTFNNFIVSVPTHLDTSAYNSVIIWCEAFNEFITAAKYQ